MGGNDRKAKKQKKKKARPGPIDLVGLPLLSPARPMNTPITK